MESSDVDRPVLLKAALFSAAFLGYIVPLLMPLFVRDISRDLQIDVSLVGYLAGAQGLIIGLVSLVVGPLSDRYGRKAVLWISLFLNGVAVIVFSTAWNTWSFYVFGVLSAVTFSPLVFCSLAYVGDYFPPEKRGATVGLVSASLWGALIVGTPLGVFVMDQPHLGWRAAILAIGVSSFVVCGIIAIGLKRIATGAEGKPIDITHVLRRYTFFLRTPNLSGFLAIIFLIRMGVGMYLIYGAAYLLTSRAFPPHGYLTVYPVGGALAFGASVWAGKLTDQIGGRPLIVLANLAIIASIIMIIHVPTTPENIVFAMVLICALYMVSESFRMAALQTEAVSKVAIELRGAFMGATSFLMYAGYAAGSLVGGIILRAYHDAQAPAESLSAGYACIVYVTSFLWFIAMILALYFTKGMAAEAMASTSSVSALHKAPET